MSIGPSSNNININELNLLSDNLVSALETPISTRADVEALGRCCQKVDSVCTQLLGEQLNSHNSMDPSALKKFNESLYQFTDGLKGLKLTNKDKEMGSILSRLDDLRSKMDATVEWQSILKEFRPKLDRLLELQNLLEKPYEMQFNAYVESLSIIEEMINRYKDQSFNSDICQLKLIKEINQAFQQITKTQEYFLKQTSDILNEKNANLKKMLENNFVFDRSEKDIEKIANAFFEFRKASVYFQESIAQYANLTKLLENEVYNFVEPPSEAQILPKKRSAWSLLSNIGQMIIHPSRVLSPSNENLVREINRNERQVLEMYRSALKQATARTESIVADKSRMEKDLEKYASSAFSEQIAKLDPSGQTLINIFSPILYGPHSMDILELLSGLEKLPIKPNLKEDVQKTIRFLIAGQMYSERELLSEISGDPLRIYLLNEAIATKDLNKIKDLITDASTSVLNTGWLEALKLTNNEIIDLFLDSGVDVNYRNMDGSTAMHFAAAHGNLKLIEKLYDFGADINSQNRGLWTPLKIAAHYGYADLIFLLHKLGCNINELTESGVTPLYAAVFEQRLNAIKAFHELGADLNAQDDKGRTVLMYASMDNKLESVKMLLKLGADKSLRDKKGHTALTLASTLLNIAIITELLGPSPNQYLAQYKLGYLPGQSSLLPLARACLERGKSLYEPQYLALKLLGHSWKMVAPSKVENTEFTAGEAAFTPMWARIMMGAFHEFAKNFRKELSVEESDLMDIYLSSITEETSPKIIREEIRKGDPVTLFTGYIGHAVQVFTYSGYLIISNKGENSRRPIEVYKINTDKLTEEILKSFLNIKDQEQIAYQSWLKEFPQILDAQTDDVCIQVENSYPKNKLGNYQLIGNCSWESTEVAVYGLLALHRTLSASKSNKNIKQASIEANVTFLHWNSCMLLHAIEECFSIYSLKEMAGTEINPMLNEIFLASEATDWSVFGKEMVEHAASLEKRYLEMLSNKNKKVYLNAKKMQKVKRIGTNVLQISALILIPAFLLR